MATYRQDVETGTLSFEAEKGEAIIRALILLAEYLLFLL